MCSSNMQTDKAEVPDHSQTNVTVSKSLKYPASTFHGVTLQFIVNLSGHHTFILASSIYGEIIQSGAELMSFISTLFVWKFNMLQIFEE